MDQPDFETLWINVKWNCKNIVCAVVYHPPKPIYDVTALYNFLSLNVSEVTSNSSVLFLSGDFNQINDEEFSQLSGLQSLVKGPTRGVSALDRLYTSSIENFSVKIVTSALKSDHKALILTKDRTLYPSFKTKTKLDYRCKSPQQHAALLSELNTQANFSSVFNNNDAAECLNNFYITAKGLLNKFYPIKTITVSDKDPPFVTPEIKKLLRDKNKLMRKSETEKAGAIADKIRKLSTRKNSRRLSITLPVQSPYGMK